MTVDGLQLVPLLVDFLLFLYLLVFIFLFLFLLINILLFLLFFNGFFKNVLQGAMYYSSMISATEKIQVDKSYFEDTGKKKIQVDNWGDVDPNNGLRQCLYSFLFSQFAQVNYLY